MTSRDLLRKLNRNPFKPFRIRMVESTVYEIADPWMIVPGHTSAIILAHPFYRKDKGYEAVQDWRTVSIQHMIQFSDIQTERNGPSKKK